MKTQWRILISVLITLFLIGFFGRDIIRYLMTKFYVDTYVIAIAFTCIALVVSLIIYFLLGLGTKKEDNKLK